jgi:hypothetical protein
MKIKRQTQIVIFTCLLTLAVPVLVGKDLVNAESEIKKISQRAFDILTVPLFGTGEVGHFIAQDASELFQVKAVRNSSLWKNLPPEQRAALKRFVELGPLTPLEIVSAEDYVFASDISGILNSEDSIDNCLNVFRALKKGNVCLSIIREPRWGTGENEWNEQFRKVKFELDHYRAKKRFSRNLMTKFDQLFAIYLDHEIYNLATKALDSMTEPISGHREKERSIVADMERVLEFQQAKDSAYWATLSSEHKAALKRYFRSDNKHLIKEIGQVSDYLFAQDVANLISADESLTDLDNIKNAINSGNVCYEVMRQARNGIPQQNWDEQYKKVSHELEVYAKTRNFSPLFLRYYNKKVLQILK